MPSRIYDQSKLPKGSEDPFSQSISVSKWTERQLHWLGVDFSFDHAIEDIVEPLSIEGPLSDEIQNELGDAWEKVTTSRYRPSSVYNQLALIAQEFDPGTPPGTSEYASSYSPRSPSKRPQRPGHASGSTPSGQTTRGAPQMTTPEKQGPKKVISPPNTFGDVIMTQATGWSPRTSDEAGSSFEPNSNPSGNDPHDVDVDNDDDNPVKESAVVFVVHQMLLKLLDMLYNMGHKPLPICSVSAHSMKMNILAVLCSTLPDLIWKRDLEKPVGTAKRDNVVMFEVKPRQISIEKSLGQEVAHMLALAVKRSVQKEQDEYDSTKPAEGYWNAS